MKETAMFDKIKQFAKDHETEIAAATLFVSGITVGVFAAANYCSSKNAAGMRPVTIETYTMPEVDGKSVQHSFVGLRNGLFERYMADQDI